MSMNMFASLLWIMNCLCLKWGIWISSRHMFILSNPQWPVHSNCGRLKQDEWWDCWRVLGGMTYHLTTLGGVGVKNYFNLSKSKKLTFHMCSGNGVDVMMESSRAGSLTSVSLIELCMRGAGGSLPVPIRVITLGHWVQMRRFVTRSPSNNYNTQDQL